MTYNDLTKQVSLLEENLEDMSFGLYKPHFSFETSEEYKTALESLRIKNGSSYGMDGQRFAQCGGQLAAARDKGREW